MVARSRIAHPVVVVGCAVAGHGIPLEPTLHGYLHGFVV
ncbi:MAG: urease accessory UreF family protein, partial [Geminicoccales bacterium]